LADELINGAQHGHLRSYSPRIWVKALEEQGADLGC